MHRQRWFAIATFVSGAAVGAVAVFIARPGGGLPEIGVSALVPDGCADGADRLSIVLDRPIAPAPQAGQPIAEPPFDLEPPRRGQWIFAAANRIEYVLEEKLDPGRTYRLRPTPGLSAALAARWIGPAELAFHTSALAVESVDLESADRRHISARVRFNQPVLPGDLSEHLTLSDARGNTPLQVQCLTREPAREHVLRFTRPASHRAQLKIAGALTGKDGELPLGAAFTHIFAVNAPFDIETVHCWPASFDPDIEVRLDFSRWLKRDQSTPTVHVTPDVGPVSAHVSGDEIRVTGPFECGRRYVLSVEPGLLADDGTVLADRTQATVRIPDRNTAVRIPQSRGILSPAGNMQLDVAVVNCPTLHVQATRVYPNNLVAHLHGGDADELGRAVLDQSITIRSSRNEPTTAVLDLASLLPRAQGLYEISARSGENHWDSDRVVIAVTDLAITCERDAAGVVAWVTSIATAKPLAGVQIEARSFANQMLAAGMTDENGLARLAIPANHADGAPWLLIASHENDISFHRLDRHVWSPADFDPGGAPPVRNYDVCLYTERGAYRPGDTIHLTGIIRDESFATPPPFPLLVRATRPDGREVASHIVTPDAKRDGMFHVDIATDEDAQLGRYTFTAAIPGSQRPLGNTSALVEAFLPVRLDVSASPVQPIFAADAKPAIDVRADYLFGKPAAGLAVSVAGVYRQVGLDGDSLAGFHAGPLAPSAESVIEPVTGLLDADGRLRIELPHAANNTPGRWRADVHVTVSEPGSRSVSTAVSYFSDPLNRHVAVRLPDGASCKVPGEVAVAWKQVDGAGAPAEPGPVRLAIARLEYDWVLSEVEGTRRWESVERSIPVLQRTLNDKRTESEGEQQAAITAPGLYRVTLTDITSGTTAEARFYGYTGDRFDESFATRLPEQVDLQLDQQSYRPGETATVAIRSAMTGTLLVTLETDRVIAAKSIEMSATTHTVDFPIPSELRRDAFINAVVVRPLEKDADVWKPMRARGIVRVPIDHAESALTLAIDAPDTAQPRELVQVTVQTDVKPTDPAPPVVHLWAVDDGILATTAFRTPDPLAHFYAPRRRTVESSDLFADLIPDFARPASMLRIGADADDAEFTSIERNPVSMKRRGGVVRWLESRRADADGMCRFDLTMPESQGRLRIMATAASGARFGHSEMPIRIVAPLMIETQFARFLAPGDTWRLPARIFNNTDDELTVTLDANVEGLASIVPVTDDPAPIKVPAHASEIIWLNAHAADIGTAHVQLIARALKSDGASLESHVDGYIPIRPITAVRTVSTVHQVPAGQSLTIPAPADMLGKTIQSRLRISPDPLASLRPAVESLVDYPYGCLEQTSSRLKGLICARQLLSPDEFDAARIDRMIHAGVSRLWSLQTTSGGLSFWPGGETDCWGSTYAATILADLTAAGYPIDAGFRKDLLQYLERELRSGDDEGTRQTRPMIAHVLARFDRAPLGVMTAMTGRAEELDGEARAYLARAWVAAGRKDMAEKLLTPDVFALVGIRARDGRLTSSLTQRAALLEAAVDCDPDSPWKPRLVEQILGDQVNGAWQTTRDTAACLAALLRCRREDDALPDYTGHVARGDKSLPFDSDQAWTKRFDGPADIQVHSQGEGQLTVTCIQQGLAMEGDTPENYDHGLRIRRRWLDGSGAPIDVSKLKIGDLIRVQLAVAAPGLNDGASVPNVVILDTLPACFEAENPALATSAIIAATDNAEIPDAVQFMDDRIVIFTSVPKSTAHIEYHVRVVALGTFAVPPIEAACMYDPTLASRHGGGEYLQVTQ